MQDFIDARQAIVSKDYSTRDANIKEIKEKWERLSAAQAVKYLKDYKSTILNDPASAYHALSEAYAFVYNLKFADLAERKLSTSQVEELLVTLGLNIIGEGVDAIFEIN